MPPRRRPLNDSDAFNGPPESKEGQSRGMPTDEFGNLLPDFSGNPNYPTPFVDYTPEEIAGSPESPRDIFGGGGGPRSSAPPAPLAQPASEPLGRPIDDVLSLLPQGVEAQGGGEGPHDVSAPLQSSEPQSVSMRAMPPSTGTGTAPMRQSVSSPMQFGGGGGRSLIGRGAGQFGGGLGLPGGPSGRPQATAQMLAILEQLLGASGAGG